MVDPQRSATLAAAHRRAWTPPAVQRLAARSAENGFSPVRPDGAFSLSS